jgi:hypothetical protein
VKLETLNFKQKKKNSKYNFAILGKETFFEFKNSFVVVVFAVVFAFVAVVVFASLSSFLPKLPSNVRDIISSDLGFFSDR